MKSHGAKTTSEEETELFRTISERYDRQTTAYYAAARLWVDAIINPIETRKWILPELKPPMQRRLNPLT